MEMLEPKPEPQEPEPPLPTVTTEENLFSSVFRYTFQATAVEANAAIWRGPFVVSVSKTIAFIVNLDTKEEAGCTYIKYNVDSSAKDYDYISAFDLSPPILLENNVISQRLAVLCSQTGFTMIYRESNKVEWIESLDIRGFKQQPDVCIQCVHWIQIDIQTLLLAIGAKDGRISLLLINHKQIAKHIWTSDEYNSWITSLESLPLYKDEEGIHKLTLLIGTGNGEVIEQSLTLSTDNVVTTGPKKDLISSNNMRVVSIRVCPWNTKQICIIRGSSLDILSPDGIQSTRACDFFLTGATWLKWKENEEAIATSSLDGNVRVWTTETEPVHVSTIFSSLPQQRGCYGIQSSPDFGHLLFLTKTPLPTETMFSFRQHKTLLEIVTVPQNDMLRHFDDLTWANKETFWHVMDRIFQSWEEVNWELLFCDVLAQWESLDRSISFKKLVQTKEYRKFQFVNALLFQMRLRGVCFDNVDGNYVEREVLGMHILACFDSFLQGTPEQQKLSLSDSQQVLSLSLMLIWLQEQKKLTAEMKTMIERLLPFVESLVPEEELCTFCDIPIPFTSHSLARCEKEHFVERCALSLLMIPCSGNYICNGCKRVAYKNATFWWLPGVPRRCPMCNLPFCQFIEF